jgi:membrane-associated phospholipid phosphatase
VAIYQLSNRFPLFSPHELSYGAIDQAVPFVPVFMAIYLLYFPLFWWTGIRSETDEAAVRFVYAAYFQLFVCALIFIMCPVRMPAGLFPDAAVAGWGASFWYWFDGPNNCLPSLHAANGLLFLHFNWNRPARWIHSAIAIGIVVSTVFVKQHYVVDVVAGAGVYLVSAAALSRVRIDRSRVVIGARSRVAESSVGISTMESASRWTEVN